MTPYKRKKYKEKINKIDQFTFTGISDSDNINTKSTEELLNSNMKIIINFNILSK